ncbi:MAG: Tol-Pal system beta propeller repeat protein TolB [Pseudomonadales bacterium]|nr:Tol-Pal system beta propeller repeat protein TolB [Pseudomonadales bacterium]
MNTPAANRARRTRGLPLATARRCRWLLALLATCVTTLAPQALEIVITEGWDDPTRIAVVPFAGPAPGEGLPDADLHEIIGFDFQRSGQFWVLPDGDMLSYPTAPDGVHYRDWRILDMDYLLIGRSWLEATGELTVVYHLFDVTSEREILSSRLSAPPEYLRDIAHRVADDVYEQITGIPGAFSTKILYVLEKAADDFELRIADSDGARARTVFRSEDPMISPTWAPDARRVAYVSFETGRSTIFIQDLETGEREAVAAFRGINGAPAFSPDGNRLAMSLSRDGNAEIYVLDLASRELERITRWPTAIETEPSWTDDGEGIIFTSDRSGRPQVYRIDLTTYLEERLTFEGDYNARARLLPGGQFLVYVHRRDGKFHIAWQDLERDHVRPLTETSLDESPSIAPNGTMMIYATQDHGRGILAVVSVDSRVRYLLPSDAGDVRDPAWSPLIDALPR